MAQHQLLREATGREVSPVRNRPLSRKLGLVSDGWEKMEIQWEPGKKNRIELSRERQAEAGVPMGTRTPARRHGRKKDRVDFTWVSIKNLMQTDERT